MFIAIANEYGSPINRDGETEDAKDLKILRRIAGHYNIWLCLLVPTK